jgi:hypothetical protein
MHEVQSCMICSSQKHGTRLQPVLIVDFHFMCRRVQRTPDGGFTGGIQCGRSQQQNKGAASVHCLDTSGEMLQSLANCCCYWGVECAFLLTVAIAVNPAVQQPCTCFPV